ncbi:hypothetical protein [Actinomadura sp. 7K507]|nr:hypothetical protein [Actinomadura sp. 7K507]
MTAGRYDHQEGARITDTDQARHLVDWWAHYLPAGSCIAIRGGAGAGRGS